MGGEEYGVVSRLMMLAGLRLDIQAHGDCGHESNFEVNFQTDFTTLPHQDLSILSPNFLSQPTNIIIRDELMLEPNIAIIDPDTTQPMAIFSLVLVFLKVAVEW